MGKKKRRAFFICPRWDEIADGNAFVMSGAAISLNEKTLAAIRERRPLARSTLRKALLIACQASGTIVDVDAYIVDRRANHSA